MTTATTAQATTRIPSSCRRTTSISGTGSGRVSPLPALSSPFSFPGRSGAEDSDGGAGSSKGDSGAPRKLRLRSKRVISMKEGSDDDDSDRDVGKKSKSPKKAKASPQKSKASGTGAAGAAAGAGSSGGGSGVAPMAVDLTDDAPAAAKVKAEPARTGPESDDDASAFKAV